MTARERGGIVGRVTEGFQSLVRDHSRVEDETARRILEEGVITDRDRADFITARFNEIARLGSILPMPSSIDPLNALTFVSPFIFAQAREEETRLKQLLQTDPTAFDTGLIDHWHGKATAWRLKLTAAKSLPSR